ncbi:hypothetical protein AX16_007035 [Volvariella volvacea WC 439]|nr:hypothetical protein AX16_007035 [Volvariella volvacea WC 439]
MFIDSSVDNQQSTMVSKLHPASLVDPSAHSPALLELIRVRISQPIIDYVVECVVETVDYAMNRPTSSSLYGKVAKRPELRKFVEFATNVITRAEVSAPTLLTALVYIDRAKPHLHIALEEWALERVFLGAIIVASKYLNDSTLKNVHWALCTGVFGKRDVGRIEREFLDVLDFELAVTEDDLLSHHDAISAIAFSSRSHRHTSLFHHSSDRKRNHTRSSAVPDLVPSSPHSSSSSSASPQTPLMMDSSPEYPSPPSQSPHKKHRRQSDHAASAPSTSTANSRGPSKKASFVSSTFDSILRSFPIPVPTPAHSHSHHHHRHSGQDPSQFPVTVVA